jgi:hypothetical protein
MLELLLARLEVLLYWLAFGVAVTFIGLAIAAPERVERTMLDILTATQWIGVAIIAILLVFAGFAFRQGMKVKPEKDKNPFGGLPPGPQA